MPIVLQDSSGNVWSFGANDANGQIIETSVGPGAVPSLYLNDLVSDSTSWRLGVTTLGNITATSVPFDASYPSFYNLSANYALLILANGEYQTSSSTYLSASSPQTRAIVSTSQIIPLTSSPNQNFSSGLQVDGAPLTLNFVVRWNEMAGYWTMSVSDVNDDLLLDSIPLITGWYPGANLLSQYEYLKIGSAYILNNGISTSDYPGRNDLGSAWSLLWSDTPSQVAA